MIVPKYQATENNCKNLKFNLIVQDTNNKSMESEIYLHRESTDDMTKVYKPLSLLHFVKKVSSW